MLQNQSLALLMLGSLLGWGMVPELHPDDWMVTDYHPDGHRIIIDMGAFH